MAKINFSLDHEQTFTVKVPIPVPGKAPALVDFTYRWLDKDEFGEFFQTLSEREPLDNVKRIVVGWGLTDAFDDDNIAKLLTRYVGSYGSILNKYAGEITGAREKN